MNNLSHVGFTVKYIFSIKLHTKTTFLKTNISQYSVKNFHNFQIMKKKRIHILFLDTNCTKYPKIHKNLEIFGNKFKIMIRARCCFIEGYFSID